MLTCATRLSTNLYWCSSPTWKPFYWQSASPAWSSRQLQIYVEHWVCCASLFSLALLSLFAVWRGMPLTLSCLCDLNLKHTHPLPSPWSLILSFRHQEIWGTVPAEASRQCAEQEKEERKERAGRYLGHWLAQRDVRSRRYTEEGNVSQSHPEMDL